MDNKQLIESLQYHTYKLCEFAYDPDYYQANKDRLNAQRKAYWQANKDKINAQRKANYDPEKRRAQYQANKKKTAIYNKNKEKELFRQKYGDMFNKYKDNEEFI